MDALPPELPTPLRRRAEAAAAWLREQARQARKVTVVHHIDADGVSAGAIAKRALERADIPHDTLAAKSLDDVHVDKVGQDRDALWFCDFGSTAYMHFPDTPRLVCDHHELVRDGTEESFPHVNPLLDDLPGDSVSGAGCAYLVAAALSDENIDLLPVALVGAAGDLQDRQGGFHGTNAALVELGVAAGLLDVQEDLRLYGIETRTLGRFLSSSREPSIPGLRDPQAVHRLLADLDIPVEEDGRQRTWSDLQPGERLRLRSWIVDLLLDAGTPAATVQGLLGPVVRIAAEQARTPVRELREFGTLLNSTARYGRPEIGLAVAAGDRGDAYSEAMELLDGHRAHLSKAIGAVARAGVREEPALQWVHLEDAVHDTVVGTVCGMALEALGLRRDVPIIGFAHTPDGRTKVSSRAPAAIQGRIDLASALREASASVGGQGGGHKGAAGATIPRGSEERFLTGVHAVVAGQLGIDASTWPGPGGLASVPAHASHRMQSGGTAPTVAPAEHRRPLKGQATLF